MKNFITGILVLFCIAIMPGVGYASNAPTIEKAKVETVKQYCNNEIIATNYTLIAQAETGVPQEANTDQSSTNEAKTETTSNATDAATPDKPDKFDSNVSDVASALNIPVDTVNSIDEIVDKGNYFVKNPPGKGAGFLAWFSYISGILGLVIGAVFWFKNKKLKELKAK